MRRFVAGAFAVLLAALVLFWMERRVGEPGAARTDVAPPLSQEPRSASDSVEVPAADVREPVARANEEERAPLANVGDRTSVAGELPANMFVARARLVDARGSPLAGSLRVGLTGGEASAVAGPDGEVALSFARARLRPFGATFEAWAQGTARKRVRLDARLLASVHETFLGEIVLVPGGDLIGRVVDETGAPVGGADVLARPPMEDAEVPAARVWLPRRRFTDERDLSTRSDADGAFRLLGSACGPVEVFASDGARLVARSAVLEVRAGAEVRVPELVLLPAAYEDRVAGIVVDSGGRPVAGATVLLLDESENMPFGPGASSRSDGRFELLAGRDRTYTVRAQDRERRQARCKDVHAGNHAVELRFAAQGTIELLVRDAAGPIALFRVLVTTEESGITAVRVSDAPGHARVEVPEEAFHLQVVSQVHRVGRCGPFEPTGAPAQLEIELEPAGGVSGVVLAGGVPLSGAIVHAHAPVAGASFGWIADGISSSVEPERLSEVRSDDAGRFFVPLLESGRYLLHAEAPEHARGTSGWFAFVDGARLVDVAVELPESGAIEGRLLAATGVDARGAWIGASDGGGHVELLQTGADGSYRFDELAPGRWQVHRFAPGRERVVQRDDARPAREGEVEPAPDVVVLAGQSARYDLDERGEIR